MQDAARTVLEEVASPQYVMPRRARRTRVRTPRAVPRPGRAAARLAVAGIPLHLHSRSGRHSARQTCGPRPERTSRCSRRFATPGTSELRRIGFPPAGGEPSPRLKHTRRRHPIPFRPNRSKVFQPMGRHLRGGTPGHQEAGRQSPGSVHVRPHRLRTTSIAIDRTSTEPAHCLTVASRLERSRRSPASVRSSNSTAHGSRSTWPAGPGTWQSEIVWREFYRYVMHHNPRVSMRQPHAGMDRTPRSGVMTKP